MEEAHRTAEQTKRRAVLLQEIAAEEKDMAARKQRTAESGGQHESTPATSATGMVGAHLPISRQENTDSLKDFGELWMDRMSSILDQHLITLQNKIDADTSAAAAGQAVVRVVAASTTSLANTTLGAVVAVSTTSLATTTLSANDEEQNGVVTAESKASAVASAEMVVKVQQQSTSCSTHTTGELNVKTVQLTAQNVVQLRREHKGQARFLHEQTKRRAAQLDKTFGSLVVRTPEQTQEVNEPELDCVGRDQKQAEQHEKEASEQAVHAESVTETKLDCLQLQQEEIQ